MQQPNLAKVSPAEEVLQEEDEDDVPTLVDLSTPRDKKSLPTPPRSCPVTILSGFLGSGKTTLVQHILRCPDHGKRIAVIENEYGEGLNVESMIARDGIDNSSLTDLIELPNGCICCTVKDSLVSTLENLVAKRPELDYILIECSGLANPGPIASLFWLDEALESSLYLDGIVTVVDAVHIEQQLSETKEAAQQIAYADRILLNKMDLLATNTSTVSGDGIDNADRIEQMIRSIQPLAQIQRTTLSAVPDVAWIIDVRCYSPQVQVILTDPTAELRLMSTTAPMDHAHGNHTKGHEDCATCLANDQGHHDHDHDHGHHHIDTDHAHTSGISTVSLIYQGSVDLQLMNRWLASLLWPHQDERDQVLRARYDEQQEHMTRSTTSDNYLQEQRIFRMKGILSVRHRPKSPASQDDEEEDDYPNDGDQEQRHLYVDESGMDRRRYILQAVYDLWDLQPVSSEALFWPRQGEDGADPRSCKIVVIGQHLDLEALEVGLASCSSSDM